MSRDQTDDRWENAQDRIAAEEESMDGTVDELAGRHYSAGTDQRCTG